MSCTASSPCFSICSGHGSGMSVHKVSIVQVKVTAVFCEWVPHFLHGLVQWSHILCKCLLCMSFLFMVTPICVLPLLSWTFKLLSETSDFRMWYHSMLSTSSSRRKYLSWRSHAFSAVVIDQAHKQNNVPVKGEGGVVGLMCLWINKGSKHFLGCGGRP